MPKATSLASPPGSSIAFPLLAITLFLFFVSASVPSPLFVVFQGRWGFSSGIAAGFAVPLTGFLGTTQAYLGAS